MHLCCAAWTEGHSELSSMLLRPCMVMTGPICSASVCVTIPKAVCDAQHMMQQLSKEGKGNPKLRLWSV